MGRLTVLVLGSAAGGGFPQWNCRCATCRLAWAGTLRAIAVTSATRLESMPEIPTVGETVQGFESAQWYGVGAPAGTPDEIIATLNKEIKAALADPNMKVRIEELGGSPVPMSSE